MVMEDIGQGVDQPLISPTFPPLFLNTLIGLKRVERNRITKVNLVDYSWERDEEGYSLSAQFQTMKGIMEMTTTVIA